MDMERPLTAGQRYQGLSSIDPNRQGTAPVVGEHIPTISAGAEGVTSTLRLLCVCQ